MSNIKRISSFILIVLMAVILSSCSEQKQQEAETYFQNYNFKALDYVELCDYKNIYVDAEYIEVSESDIVTVIEMDMEYYNCMKPIELDLPEEDFYALLRIDDIANNESSEIYYLIGSDDFGSQFEKNLKKTDIYESFIADIDGVESKITNMGYFKPATIEDEKIILDFYGFGSMDDVYEYIRNETKTNIIFHYMMDKILENTAIINLPVSVSNSYDENSASFWNDVLIYKAILEKEGKELTIGEFEQELERAAKENELTISTVLEENADSVLHFALEQKIKNILVDYINVY